MGPLSPFPLAPAPGASAPLRAAVLGHPVAHSLSPVLHAAAYRQLGRPAEYVRRDVPEHDWDGFLAGARRDGGWSGFSVTMPLKALAARDAQYRTPLVRALGVANTLTVRPDGSLAADNTDVMGIMSALAAAGEIPADPTAVVLGGGATATAALAALHGLGASRVDAVVRSPHRARSLHDAAAALGARVRVRGWDEAPAALQAADVVVCTLPPHGADELAHEWERRAPTVTGVLLDVAYDPWPSALAGAWRAAGGAVVPGVDMLVFQAVDQVRWFIRGEPRTPVPHEDAVTAAMCRAVQRPERRIPERVRRAQTTRLAG
ncbi:shikimate dehydrogenase [Kocuria sp.]|uniref:shikimate dehydrogenase family protein n=1 Tax=Kocuria sp. TaxID=1871328 RepID=UPI0026DAD38A|nr:NAD(P)-binding domain-containing protein [Kocuria sp.]MDO4919454.1 NAD(P)-binding domain-containing protein [Kocuria sp.]